MDMGVGMVTYCVSQQGGYAWRSRTLDTASNLSPPVKIVVSCRNDTISSWTYSKSLFTLSSVSVSLAAS